MSTVQILGWNIRPRGPHANSCPQIVLTLDREPDLSTFRYRAKRTPSGTAYWAEQDGFVRFLYDSGNGQGYGGRVFDLTLVDGRKVSVVGPWSSRAGVMNRLGFPPCVEIVHGIDPGHEHSAWLAITLDLARTLGIALIPTAPPFGSQHLIEEAEPVWEPISPYPASVLAAEDQACPNS